VDKLPLNQIVIDLLTDLEDSEWSGRGGELSELVGKLMFKIDLGGPRERPPPDYFLNTFDDELLYCYYFHDVNDIWVIPFTFSAIFRVQVNSTLAIKSLYYTPPVPLVSFEHPFSIYESLRNRHVGRIPIFTSKSVGIENLKATRILFDNDGRLDNFEVLMVDNRFKNGHKVLNASDEEVNMRPEWLRGRDSTWFNTESWVHERFYRIFGIHPTHTHMQIQTIEDFFKWNSPYLILVPINPLSLNYPRGDFSVI
jgi:hypothetical protein